MAISNGTRLGFYEIAESIGVGGMGEVYRATDTNLKRDVAIKVLPESFAQDFDRLSRFQREAEVLASLNHVNIAHVYGLERGQKITALVMELVEGPTLAERLEQGPIPVDEALGIAMQIAEALEAAHERGIVHRDLKPANIKLRPDGLVKVLDFGIAKALDTHAGHSGSQSPVLTTPAMTEAGVILGTAAYMSPEQARGKKVDQRADIWAFGCVLYEMLTGQPAFGAEDVTTTLARILERGVDLSELPQSVPPAVRHTLKLCLEKDVRKRIRHIGDVKLAITGAFETGPVVNSAEVAATAARGRMGWAAFAVAAVLALAFSLPALQHLNEEAPLPTPPPPETRLEIVTPATDFPESFALSPDGRHIVFVASDDSGTSQLWLRSLASTTADPLTGTEGATQPFWSPDGRSIGFNSASGLKRLDIGGGAPQTLSSADSSRGGSWGADNTMLFASSSPGSPLMRQSATGGAATAFTTLEPGQTDHGRPYFLPDGRRFLFQVYGTPETAGIYLGHLDGTAPVKLTAAGSGAVFHPDGWLLWSREGTLTAQRLDLAQAVLTGNPIALADSVEGRPSVSSTGLIAYRTGSATGSQLTWVDRTGTELGTLGEPDATMFRPRLSPDGRRVAVDRWVQGNLDIWLLDGARTTRFTFDVATDSYPLWSPDGSRIVFRSSRAAGSTVDLYLKSSSGAGEETLLVSSDQTKTATSWSADGRFLLYIDGSPQTGRDLWAVPMTGDPVPFPVLQTPFTERYGTFSPDGRWIAYESNESGKFEVYVRPFVAPDAGAAPVVGGQWQISTEGGIYPVWSPDGQELYYLDPAGNMVAAPIMTTGDRVEAGAPEVLFSKRIVGGGQATVNRGRQYDVAPDGRFLINTEVGEGGNAPITLIQNWNPEAAQ